MRTKRLVHAKELQTTVNCDVSKSSSPWEIPFYFGKMPPTIVEACGKVAPFLYGREGAEYNTKFFHNVLQLNNSGLWEKDLSDVVCPHVWLRA
jgi:hypothetical protein